ncbi:hypothetical protein HK105_204373 [Polyrhizophydium stewartii]|uniref:Phosphate transporter n=1 Tax=Polyrhizophydium stewartii TaxID=2732419 RepID=A0ABR4N8W9_9FUNG|nr:hypothetical protein HK105_003612 [Polyrhizophydium stewartii]
MQAHDFTWIFAITVIFAVLDAFSIGANDVANSFATSVGSRSLKLWHAVCIAIFTEAGGAMLLGAETTDTIKNNIISVNLFKGRPELLMQGFMCALIASSVFVMFATYMGWPVSTTHTIVGAISGVGISAYGGNAVVWQWAGMGKIIASWFTSPVIAGILASIIYLITKFAVLRSKNALRAGIYAIPWYFAITLGIMFFYVGQKNGRWTPVDVQYDWEKGGFVTKKNDWAGLLIPTAGVFGGVLVIGYAFVAPYFIRLLEKEEDLAWYHIFYIWFVPTQPKNEALGDHLALTFTPNDIKKEADIEAKGEDAKTDEPKAAPAIATVAAAEDSHMNQTFSQTASGQAQKAVAKVKELLHKSLFADVATLQSQGAKKAHEVAIRYDNKVEYLYSMLQVCTAAFASFAHGSNDVANSVGPLSGVYSIWSSGALPATKVRVETWILAIGAIGIDLGLALYGYNIMRSLGNNLTYHSPSRGFSMELGAALTVITASFLGIPVSTTHCIVGATVGVGLCNGSLHAVNWGMFAWCLFSWIITVPTAGVAAGLLFALLTRGASFSY